MYRYAVRNVGATLALVTGVATSFIANSHATTLALDFASLPSAQGWTFSSGGSPLATEAGTWSVGSGILTLDSMAFSIAGAGTSAFYVRTGQVSTTEPLVISVRARIVQFEGDFTNTFVGGGFAFGFGQGSTSWQMGITPTQIRSINGVVLSTAYDNTQFHDYRLEWTPPASLRFYVDSSLISTQSGGFSFASNRIYFGDVTGAANSRAEITHYLFLQGAVVGTSQATWGTIKELYR